MVKYYELYSTRLKTWREQGQEVIALEYKAMQNEGPVDVYVVYVFNGGIFSLTRNAQGQLSAVTGVVPFQSKVTPADGVDELIRLPVTGTIAVDVYIATLDAGVPVESLNFKTLQLTRLVF